jgi:hypothetical protein
MQLIEQLLPPLEILESLLAVTICALVILRTAVVFLVRRRGKSPASPSVGLELFFWVVSVFIVGYLVADLNRSLDGHFDRSAITALTVVSMIGAVGFSAVALTASFGVRFLRPRALLSIHVLYVWLLIGAGSWFVSRTYAPTTLNFSEAPGDSMNLMSEASDYLAVTDEGSQIALFEIDLRDRSDEARVYLATSTTTPTGAKVIPRADASINANCHGWVFTAGKYLLKGRSVDLILADNGYTVQGTPEPGDVIVYRSPVGECLHTGIVSGILLDGTCIIESKWGIAGRYLHQAEDQPYGLNYAYYRSPRSGHLVTILHKNDLDAFLTNLKSANRSGTAAEAEEDAPTENDESELQPSLED